MSLPITYVPELFSKPEADKLFHTLWNELDWVRHDKVPRREYYTNDVPEPYKYGLAAYARTYNPQPWHPALAEIRGTVEGYLYEAVSFEVCFLNGYENSKDQLGWHADDSPEMDDDRPIAIVSLGAERQIWFRPNPAEIERQVANMKYAPEPGGFIAEWDEALDPVKDAAIIDAVRLTLAMPEKKLLQHGSLCLMHAGMQDTHQHRIPKVDREVGPRISLTFRGYKK